MDHDIAVQSAIFGDVEFDAVVSAVDDAPVSRIELWNRHLPPSADMGTVRDARRRLADVGVEVVGYGVVDLDDPEQVEAAFATAAELGAGYLTVNFDPTDERLGATLVDAAETHDIDAAIHNYSTVHHDTAGVFSSIEEVRAYLDDHPHPRLGACIDTGHFLVMDEDPEAAIAELGERVTVVHLKDTSDAAEEDVPGRGALSLPTLIECLRQDTELATPLVVEYELPPDETASALEEARERLRAI